MKLKDIIKKLLTNKLTLICSIFIIILIILGIFAPTISRHDPIEMDLTKKFLPLSFEYPMGTDNMGRCIFCRIIHGIRPTIGLSLIACFISSSFGIFIGMLSGFSFLGLGVKAPFPEWGMMINDGRAFMHSNPMLMFWPGIMILLVVLSSNIIGDNLRDYLEEATV